jgi:O-antigen ligase
VAVRGPAPRVGLLTLMFLGLWFCASRAGLVALPFVLGACIYVRASSLRELAIVVMCAAILASALAAPGLLAHGDTQRELAASITPDLMRSPELNSLNNKERLLTILGGWQLFVDHPIFGAGLGAFRHQEHVSTSGQPLLIHSSPIWLLAEMGIVGFLIFAVPVLHILLTEVRRRHRDMSSKLLVICLVAFGIMSVPADMIYQRTFWLLIGAALALRHTSEGRATGAPNQEA